MLMGASDSVAPRRRIVWITREKVSDACVIEDVVCRQAPDPGKSPDVDGKPGTCHIPATTERIGVGRR